jgi:hypothetical protein
VPSACPTWRPTTTAFGDEGADLQWAPPEAHLFLADAYSQLGQDAKARSERAEAERLKHTSEP